jgi:hypothetical protein
MVSPKEGTQILSFRRRVRTSTAELLFQTVPIETQYECPLISNLSLTARVRQANPFPAARFAFWERSELYLLNKAFSSTGSTGLIKKT